MQIMGRSTRVRPWDSLLKYIECEVTDFYVDVIDVFDLAAVCIASSQGNPFSCYCSPTERAMIMAASTTSKVKFDLLRNALRVKSGKHKGHYAKAQFDSFLYRLVLADDRLNGYSEVQKVLLASRLGIAGKRGYEVVRGLDTESGALYLEAYLSDPGIQFRALYGDLALIARQVPEKEHVFSLYNVPAHSGRAPTQFGARCAALAHELRSWQPLEVVS